MNKKERNTTVAITPYNAKQLDGYCTKIGIQKIEFIPLALAFFNKYSINILSHEAPNEEMSKLLKRVEFLVSFLKKQENELIRPLCESTFTIHEEINLNLEKILSKQDIKPLSNKIQYILSDLLENKNQVDRLNLSQEQSFKLLARLIDAKAKTTILNDLSKAYNQK